MRHYHIIVNVIVIFNVTTNAIVIVVVIVIVIVVVVVIVFVIVKSLSTLLSWSFSSVSLDHSAGRFIYSQMIILAV